MENKDLFDWINFISAVICLSDRFIRVTTEKVKKIEKKPRKNRKRHKRKR